MSTQPEALQLAKQLETEWGDDCELDKAAAELRRLHAQRDELLAALRPLITKRMGAEQIREGIQRAIAKAEASK